MGKRVVAVVVGAVVAVALVAGGVVLAGGNSRRTPATLPALDLSGSGAATAQGAAPSDGSGTPDSGTESRITPSGRVQYQVRGTLPDLPRSAKAWILPDQVTRDRVAQLARALGIAGEPARNGQTWTVTDGTRRLFVNQVPGGPWTMSDGRTVCAGPVGGIAGKGGAGPGIIACPAVPPFVPSAAAGRSGSAPSAAAGQAGSASVATGAAPPAAGVPATPVPTKQGAVGSRPPVTLQPPQRVPLPDRVTVERIARDLFARTFAPTDGLDVQFVQGFDRWSVSAFPRVGGLATAGYLWTAGIGAKGQVLSATGWLGSPRAGDTYPLISVQEALQRLRNRQVAGPMLDDGSVARPCASTGLPSRPSPGGCDPGKPLTFQVTDVRLGLQLATALTKPSGGAQRAAYLVPAYQFQLDGSWLRQVSVIAVQDRFLGTTPTPTAVPLESGG